MIDVEGLARLCGNSDYDRLKHDHRQRVEESLDNMGSIRESCWTESIAVGSKMFIDETKEKLGHKSQGRNILRAKSKYSLKEPSASYSTVFDPKKELLRSKNAYFWDNYTINSIG